MHFVVSADMSVSLTIHDWFYINCVIFFASDDVMLSMSDSLSKSLRFDSWPFQFHVMTLGKLSTHVSV